MREGRGRDRGNSKTALVRAQKLFSNSKCLLLFYFLEHFTYSFFKKKNHLTGYLRDFVKDMCTVVHCVRARLSASSLPPSSSLFFDVFIICSSNFELSAAF